MCQKSQFLPLILYSLTLANEVTTCGEQIRNESNVIIQFSSGFEETNHCYWTVFPPENKITSISVIKSNVVRNGKLSSLCLTIKGALNKYLETCSQKLIHSTRLSVREGEIMVNIKSVRSYSNVWLVLASRNETECPNSDFQCLDKSNCYNTTDLFSKDTICNDNSDKLATGKCEEMSTPCYQDYDICFNITQRCDGVVNCPRGQDEFNCSSLCPNLIKCPLEDKCIQESDICDRSIDCSDRFDEQSCQYGTSSSKIFIVTIVFVVCSLCCIIFVCLVFRWVVTKRDINRFLENLPEIPLAPFQGPGEDDSDSGSSDLLQAEFRQGGEIYEHYMASLKKKSRSSKAIQVGDIVPKFSHLELDAENEFVVLASLNVPGDMCVGLTISESSIESIKTLKSVRKNSASCSSVSDPDATGSVRSKSAPKVKFEFTLDANSVSKASLSKRNSEKLTKPEANFAGGDFFILTKADLITESENLFLQKERSAPLLCSVSDTPTIQSSKSVGNFSKVTDAERDIAYQKSRIFSSYSDRSSQWTDLEECENFQPSSNTTKVKTVETRVESVEKKLKLVKRSCKKKIGYSVRM